MFKNSFPFFLFFFFLFTSAFAQAPQSFNYQAVVRGSGGELVANQAVAFRISILNGSSEGDVLYVEKQHAQTNEFGLVVFAIGKGSSTFGDFSAIDWGANSRWLKIEFKRDTDSEYVVTGVTQLLSVPYALYAENAGGGERAIDFTGTNGQTIRNNNGVWEATSTLFNNGTNVGIGTTTPLQKLDLVGNLNIGATNGYRIGNAEIFHARGGSGNLFLGTSSGVAISTGYSNVVAGQSAGRSLTTGYQNMLFGNNAGRNITSGFQNAFIGVNAGFSANGTENAFIGANAGYYNTGNRNTYIGRSAGFGTVGVTTGSNNTFIGGFAGKESTTGSGNLALGTNSQVGPTVNFGVAVGYNASATGNNAIAIGPYAAATTANSLVLGSIIGVNSATVNTNVGIGTTAPTSRLHVVGQTLVEGQLMITGGTPGIGKVLVSDENGLASWQTVTSASTTAPGSNKQILINDAGALGTSTNFVFDKVSAQLGVGTATPNAAAVADFTSTNKGVLFPRLTTAQRNAIASPPDGLVIYNTTINCFEFRLAGGWKSNCDTCITPSASAGSDQTEICPFTLSLSGNNLASGQTGLWTIVSGAGGSIASPTSPTSNFTGTAGTTYVIRWSITGNCGVVASDEVSLTFKTGTTYYRDLDADGFGDNSNTLLACQQPLGYVTTSGDCNDANLNIRPGANEICDNTIDDDCDGQVDEGCCPAGFDYCDGNCVDLLTSLTNCGGCGIVCSLPNAITACNAGSCVLVGCQSGWSNADGISANGCEFDLNTPISANAGPDQSLFCTTSTSLAANIAAPAVGNWSIISGAGGTVSTPNSASSSFSGVLGTTYVLRWSVANGVNTVSDDVQISFNTCPAVPNGTNTCVNGVCVLTCNSNFGNCDGNSANGCEVDLRNSVLNCGGCGQTGTFPNAQVACVNGTLTIAACNSGWADCNGNASDGCELQISTVAANAGPDQLNVCGTNVVTLAGNNPSISGTKTWSKISGTGGTFSSTTNPGATFTGIAGQTYTLRWTISISGCPGASTSDEVIVSFPAAPTTANAGIDRLNTCGSSFVLSGNALSASETCLWTVQSGSGGSFSQSNIATPSFSGVPGETYTLRYTITNANCSSSNFDEMQISFRFADVANAGPDQINVCNPVTLNANAPQSSNGTWSVISGSSGSFTNVNLNSSSFSGIPETTYVLRWTFNNSCQTTTDDVTITLGPAIPPTIRFPQNFNAGSAQLNICGTTANLAASSLTPGNTGLWTVESGNGGSFSNANSPNSTFTGNPGSAYVLRWTESNTCGSIFALVNISFRPVPVSNAGSDQTNVCNTQTVNLSANTLTGAFETGNWSVASIQGDGTISVFSAPTSPTSTFTGSASTTYTLVWIVSDGCSTTTTDTVQIAFGPSNPSAQAGTDQLNVCGNTLALAANAPSAHSIGAWTIQSGVGGSFADASSNTSVFSGIPGNSYTLRWTVSNTCATQFDDLLVSFVPTLSTANAGIDQNTVCGTFTTLSGNVPTEGIGSWAITSGSGGSLSMINGSSANLYGLAGGVYTLTYTITNACASSSDAMQVNFIAPISAQAGIDLLNICGTTTTLAGNAPGSGNTGTWTVISGSNGSFSDVNALNAVFTGLAGSTYTLRWTISNACSSTFDEVLVSFLPTVTTANAGSDQLNICNANAVALAGNSPSNGTGTWSVVSGSGGSIAASSSATSSFSGLSSTTYTLRWTVSNGCTSSTDDVTISFGPATPTLANAGPDQLQKCGTSATLAGNTASSGTGAWTIISGTGGAITTPASPTSGFTGTAGSTYTLRWTISNACGSNYDEVVISFVPSITTASAGSDQTNVCAGAVNLAANTAVNGTGAWSVVSGAGGAFASSTAATTQFTGTVSTSYTLRWTINNGCSTSTDDVVVSFGPAAPTTANAGPDQLQKCGTSLTLAANTPSSGTGAWSILSGTGGAVTTASSATSNFTGTAGTTYTLRWTTTTSCGTSTDEVDISFVPTITTANAGADQTGVCATSVILSANTAVNGTSTWTVVSGTGGSFASSSAATTQFSGNVSTSYSLRWTISNGCTTSTDDVTISFGPAAPTAANAGPDQLQKCGTSVTLAANTPSSGTGAWTIISGTGGTITTASNASSAFSGTAGSTYTLRWTTTTTCGTSTDDVVISFVPTLTTANAGADQTGICAATVNLAANTAVNGTGAWSIVSGLGGSFASSTAATSQFSGTAGTTYVLRWTISNGCSTSTDDVTIAFGPSLLAQPGAFTSFSSNVCQGQTAVLYTVPIVAGTSYNWTYTGTGATINQTNNSVSINFSTSATGGELSVTAGNDCGQSPPRSVSISVSNPVVASIEGPTCVFGDITTQYYAPQSANASYAWSYSGTGLSITNGTTSTINGAFSSATTGVLSLTIVDQCLNVSTSSRTITLNTCTLCVGSLQFPTLAVTPNSSGNVTTISANNYAGDYPIINLLAGKFYKFSSSEGTDRLTLTTTANVGLVVGTGEVTYFSPTAQTVRMHIHTNSSCGTENVYRTTKVKCLNCQ